MNQNALENASEIFKLDPSLYLFECFRGIMMA